MSLLDLLVLALATWFVADVIVKRDAPFKLMARFRSRTTLGGLLTCIFCTAPWIAALMWLLLPTPLRPVVEIAAVSGAALMLASYTGTLHA